MNIIHQLKSNLSVYSRVQREIATYIIENIEDIPRISSQSLAEKASVSQSAVIKFVQSLGYKKFMQFKVQLSSDLANEQIAKSNNSYLHNSIEKTDSLEIIAKKLMLEKEQAISQTVSNIDYRHLKKVKKKILTSRRVMIFGIGGSAFAAQDFSMKLQKLGICAFAENDAHIQLANIQSMDNSDMLIAISYSGQHKEVKVVAEMAKKKGGYVCAITSLQKNPLSDIADAMLFSVADEHKSRSSSISSRTAQNAVTDLLFMTIVVAMGTRAENMISQGSKAVKALM